MESSTGTRYWFPAKRYGWGWGMPRTWQGLTVLLSYVAVVLAAGVLCLTRTVVGLAVIVLASVAVTWICLKKGEPPRWRWGRGTRS